MKKLKLLFFSLLITATAFSQFLNPPIPARTELDDQLLKVRINLFHGGQNSSDLSDVLEANQGTLMQNVVLNRKGQLSKRKGQALFVKDLGDTAHTGIGRFDPDPNTSNMMVASGTSIIKALSSASDWIIVDNNQTSGRDTEFVQANELLFTLNGVDPVDWYDNTIWTVNTEGATSPPTGAVAAWLRNYLFVSGVFATPDWVYFSNNLNPLIFTSGDVFRVNTGDGQKVVQLLPYRLFELVIYKERSIYILNIEGTTPLTDWTVQPITKSVGLIAPRSLIDIGNDHWFLSSDPIAVRTLVRTEFDKILMNRMSDPIQDIFDGTGETTINKTRIDQAAAVLFDDKYILAIVTGTSTVNNTVVVYDFITKSWYIIDGWFPAAWVKFNNRLYYIDAKDGKVIQVFQGVTGDFISPGVILDTSNPTIAINYDYISKSIDFDNPENFKRLDSLEVEFDTTGNYDATVSINLDNEGWQQVGTINLSGGAVTLPVDLPFTLLAGGIARQTFHLSQYGNFKKIQVRVEQDGLGEEVNLLRFSIFAKLLPWRRE